MGCKNDFQGHILKLPVLINQRCASAHFVPLHVLKHAMQLRSIAAAIGFLTQGVLDFMVNGHIHDIGKMHPFRSFLCLLS